MIWAPRNTDNNDPDARLENPLQRGAYLPDTPSPLPPYFDPDKPPTKEDLQIWLWERAREFCDDTRKLYDAIIRETDSEVGAGVRDDADLLEDNQELFALRLRLALQLYRRDSTSRARIKKYHAARRKGDRQLA